FPILLGQPPHFQGLDLELRPVPLPDAAQAVHQEAVFVGAGLDQKDALAAPGDDVGGGPVVLHVVARQAVAPLFLAANHRFTTQGLDDGLVGVRLIPAGKAVVEGLGVQAPLQPDDPGFAADDNGLPAAPDLAFAALLQGEPGDDDVRV